MELLEIGSKIQECIDRLSQLGCDLGEISQEKDTANAKYEKTLAKVIMELRSGKGYEFEGEVITTVPTTIIERIAKGICWEIFLKKEQTESTYRNHLKIIEIVQSQLNGYQSVFRYLEEQ